jgi:hypothetical protein
MVGPTLLDKHKRLMSGLEMWFGWIDPIAELIQNIMELIP